jgi:hypothetical protein
MDLTMIYYRNCLHLDMEATKIFVSTTVDQTLVNVEWLGADRISGR